MANEIKQRWKEQIRKNFKEDVSVKIWWSGNLSKSIAQYTLCNIAKY